MIIGIPKEVKKHEYRVSMTPAGVEELTRHGHSVLVETQAGAESGLTDEEYVSAGGSIVPTAKDVFGRADMIIKVKEPQASEWPLMKEGQVMFTYFHFAASRELTEGCLQTKSVCIAYETIQDAHGRLPLLTPMSEVAGKMSIQEGAKYLEKPMTGRGILLGGVPGVEPAEVMIIGGGVVGTCAAKIAAGMGAHVFILDIDLDRLRYLDDVMPDNVDTIYSNQYNIRKGLRTADLVVGAVLIPGARCPVLIPREYLSLMKPGSVIVDVGVDQGGCCETIRPTTHDDPVYVVDGVVHYGVANMPGACCRTSTIALTNATLPYTIQLANLGYKKACAADCGLAKGVDMELGKLTNQAVAEYFKMPCTPASVMG
jgi:alanine dehydrogenase